MIRFGQWLISFSNLNDRTLFVGILHQNVPDNVFLLTPRNKGSFDDTAISHHNIGYPGSRDVSGWVIITNLSA